MDLSAYSNEELLAMYGKKKSLSEMSNDELLSLYNQRNRQPSIVDEIGAPTQQPDVTGVSPMMQMGLIAEPRSLTADVAGGVAKILGPPEPLNAAWWGPIPPVARNATRDIANLAAGVVPSTIDMALRPVPMLKETGGMLVDQAKTIDDLLGRPRSIGSVFVPTDVGAIPEGSQRLAQNPLGPLATAAMIAGAVKGVAGLRGLKAVEPLKVAPEISAPVAEAKPAPIMSPSQAEAVKIRAAMEAPKPEPVDVNKFQNVNLEHIPADLQVEVDAIGSKSGKLTKIKDTAVNALKEVEDRIGQYKALWECLKA